MSGTRTLADKLKAAPAVSDAKYKSVVLTDGDGKLSKQAIGSFFCKSLAGSEPVESTLSLQEFIKKYVEGMPVGSTLSDKDYQNSTRWYLNLKDGLRVNLQDYVVMITKNSKVVSSAWAKISLFLIPCSSTEAYTVTYITGESASVITVLVKRFTLTVV